MSRRGHGARWSKVLPVAALLLASVAHDAASGQTPSVARPPSELAACGTAHKHVYTELAQRHEAELRHHAMHPVLVARLKGLGATFAVLRKATARNPRNAAECEKTTQALDEAREQLERIAGSPAQREACLAANRQLYADTQASLLGLQTGTVAATPPLVAAADRLDRLRAAVARDDVALADCRQLADELAEGRAQVQGLLAPQALARPVAAAPLPASLSASNAAACRQAQARNYNELAQVYARLVAGGPVPVEWMAPLQALSGRMKQLHAAIADPAAPGWDCDAVARALARERTELATMSRR